jgi:hypothetical protein
MIQVNCYKFGHGLQPRAHSCSTTHFQLLRTQGHVFPYSDTPLLAETLLCKISIPEMLHLCGVQTGHFLEQFFKYRH